MSLLASYIAEREGNLLLEEEWGFIEYRISAPICAIHSIFVRKQDRGQGRARFLADRVTHFALDAGCNVLWSQVDLRALNGNDSLKASLAYGFIAHKADGDVIILTKDIGGP